MSSDSGADATAILGLMNLPRVGTVAIHRILDAIGQRGTAPRHLLDYDAASLVGEELLTEQQAASFTSEEQREWRAGAMAVLESSDVRLIPITADTYPQQLRRRPPSLAPPLLMTVGSPDPLLPGGIAFAGARQASDQGLAHTRALVAKAVAQRFTVVSGGAKGTDAATHDEALASGGSTAIVLAEGILSARARHYAPLLERGRAAIVSTFLPHDAWAAWRAMERNRYILGLCERLVVIEAGVRGGTLAAGREAIEAGMETWVLDYPDPPESAAGNRLLLEMGARPIPVSTGDELSIPAEVYALGDWVVTEIRDRANP